MVHLLFLTIPDKNICPYCESIQWWGVDVQVLQDLVWQKLTLLDNGFNMPSIIKTRLKFVVYILCNHKFVQFLSIDDIDALHAKRLSSLYNGKLFIWLRTGPGKITKNKSNFSTIINPFDI